METFDFFMFWPPLPLTSADHLKGFYFQKDHGDLRKKIFNLKN